MCGLTFHKVVASAISGDTQKEWLQVFVDAQSQCVVSNVGVGLDLPPFAVFA
jgi:hypothetical protein